MNNKYMDKEQETKNYDKVIFSVASSADNNWQGRVCLKALMTTLKCILKEAKRSTCFTLRFRT